MKRLFTLMFLAAFALGTQAQNLKKPAVKLKQQYGPQTTTVKPRLTGLEALEDIISVPHASNRISQSTMGSTYYDLQSNASIGKKLHNWGDGRVSGVWTLSNQTSFADRGTGYNKSDNSGEFAAIPTSRVESVRTGFPVYVVTGDNEEWIFAHTGPGTIHYSHKNDTETTWTEGDLPATSPAGHLWARAAVGGLDGRTLHVIALTIPTGNGGVIVDGMNGALRYWRSTDGGATWDIQDQAIPGVDSTRMRGLSGDAYAIDASGETVAIGVFDLTSDAMVIKSTDNGTTWDAPRIVVDFPFERWEIGDGYTNDQNAPYVDTTIWVLNDTSILMTTDETGNVFVDPIGVVHVATPLLFITDTDTTDGGSYQYYPGAPNLLYWNDLLDDNTGRLQYGQLLEVLVDIDGDGVWGQSGVDIQGDGYGDGFATIPTFASDADGRIYLSYNSHHEIYVNSDENIYHRFPFITVSDPVFDTESWTSPKELLARDLVLDTFLLELSENYFANLAPTVDANVHAQWQQDFVTGITLRFNPAQTPEINEILYLRYNALALTSTSDVQVNAIDMLVSPNPVRGNSTFVQFELENAADTRIDVINTMGSLVSTQLQGELPAGPQQFTVPVNGLSNGIYFLRVQAGNKIGIKKIVVAR